MATEFYNNFKTALLLGLLTGLILLGGELIAGQQGLIVAVVIAAVANFAGYFYSDKIALASANAEEVGPDHPLYGIVERLAQRAAFRCRTFMSPRNKLPTHSPPAAIRSTPPSAPRRDFWTCSAPTKSPA